MTQMYLTKNAPVKQLKKGEDLSTTAMLKFQAATDEELQKALGDSIPDGYVAGWASTPDLDLYRHVVKTGAFDESIRERGLTGPRSVKLLLGHDRDKVAGVIKVLETRNGRLWIEAQLNLKISYAKDAYEACLMSGGMNFSVGFMLQDYSFKEDNDNNEYLEIARGDLFEVSIVPFPGNEDATMEFVKSKEEDLLLKTVAEFEKFLVSKGLVKNRNQAQELTRVVKENLKLFQKEEPTQVVVPPKAQPLLAAKQLDDLMALVGDIKKLVAPAAE